MLKIAVLCRRQHNHGVNVISLRSCQASTERNVEKNGVDLDVAERLGSILLLRMRLSSVIRLLKIWCSKKANKSIARREMMRLGICEYESQAEDNWLQAIT